MSRKIIGVTVGTQLPKPNFKQTDPTKGDYIKNKPDFDGLKTKVNDIQTLVGDKKVSEQITTAMEQKSQVQMITQDVSEVLPTLKIHKLTQEEYDQKLTDGTLDENALYLTPDEEIDLSPYATVEQLDTKADVEHIHEDVNTSLANLNTLVGDTKVSDQISEAIKNKSDVDHTHTAAEIGADVSGSAASALSDAKSYTDTKISELINGAPTTLDTIGEIAAAMSENVGVVEALDSAIGSKANASDLTAHINNKSNPHGVTLSQLGVTATAAELNYIDGVTSNVQGQLDGLSNLIGDDSVSAQINNAVAQKSQVQIITWEADD